MAAKVGAHVVLVQEWTKLIDQALSGSVFGDGPNGEMARHDDVGHVLGLEFLQLFLDAVKVGLGAQHVLFGSEDWRSRLPVEAVVAAHGDRVDHDEADEGFVVGVVELDVDGVVIRGHDPTFELVCVSDLCAGVSVVIVVAHDEEPGRVDQMVGNENFLVSFLVE